ncbi:MAG: hypothetical protein ACI4XE_05435 [Acutalibacteraceae bacterium]
MKDGKLTEIKNKPEILSIVINGDNDCITLKWCPAVGADKYFIKRKSAEDRTFKTVGVTKSDVTKFTDKTVSGEGEYSYRIVAKKKIKGADPIIKKSKTESVTIVRLPVINFEKVLPDSDTAAVSLSWKKAENVDGYVIYRRYSFMNKPINLARADSDTTGFVDSSTVKGQLYYYSIRSFVNGKNGKSFGSRGKESPVIVLDKPFLLEAKRLHRKKVRFSFRLSAGADGYAVFRSEKEYGAYIETARTEGQFVFECTDCAEKKAKGAFYRFACYKNVEGKEVYGKKTEPIFIKYKL